MGRGMGQTLTTRRPQMIQRGVAAGAMGDHEARKFEMSTEAPRTGSPN